MPWDRGGGPLRRSPNVRSNLLIVASNLQLRVGCNGLTRGIIWRPTRLRDDMAFRAYHPHATTAHVGTALVCWPAWRRRVVPRVVSGTRTPVRGQRLLRGSAGGDQRAAAGTGPPGLAGNRFTVRSAATIPPRVRDAGEPAAGAEPPGSRYPVGRLKPTMSPCQADCSLTVLPVCVAATCIPLPT
jgi:hypothetical protein